VFDQIVKPYLGQLEFDDFDAPRRWWPMGKRADVVVDPALSFGEPVVADAGVPAHVLAEALRAETEYDPARAMERVSALYRVKPRHVQSAVRFEEWLNAA
jgi:uncharacterized protein (DUF433 family)